MMAGGRHWPVFWGAGLSLTGAVLLSMAVGPAGVSPGRVLDVLWTWLSGRPQGDTAALIVLQLRLPRILLSAMVGAGLAGAGTAFQAILHNPLADPYVIGVSAGAGLGAALGIALGLGYGVGGVGAVPLLAFCGALFAVSAVYFLARIHGRITAVSLILAGVAVGAFLTAVLWLLLVYFRRNLDQVVFWLMGGFSRTDWPRIVTNLPYLTLGLAVLIFSARNLNLMTLGDETAAHLGVNVRLTRNLILAAGSILAAAAVAVSGVIGFVGLMIPHISRFLVGGDHRRLIPFAVLCGGAFLVCADTLARVAFQPLEMPVGIVTALSGGPFFLWLLRRKGGAV